MAVGFNNNKINEAGIVARRGPRRHNAADKPAGTAKRMAFDVELSSTLLL
ncbi:MAG: hypothetical protein ABW069_22270 [Duganella sp.]